MLDAIARSDATRESVLEQLKASRVKNGILGSFRFDRRRHHAGGVPILRITGQTPPGAGLPEYFEGVVLDRVVKVPAPLLR